MLELLLGGVTLNLNEYDWDTFDFSLNLSIAVHLCSV